MMKLQKDEGKLWPKISIITPSYNQGQFLERTILSVLEQNYPNLEYIIIDGFSTDNSVEIIKKYNDNLAYWVSEPDGGQASAVNKGFRMATGDIVGWLNSDDMLFSRNTLSKIAGWFAQNPNIDMCYGHNIYIDEYESLIFFRSAMPLYSPSLLRSWNFIHQPTVFFRAGIIREHLLNEDFHSCLDYELWLRLTKQYQFGPIYEVITASRWHSKSKTVSEPGRNLEELGILHEMAGAKHGFSQKIVSALGYSLLRLWGGILLLDIKRLKSEAIFDLKIPCFAKVWSRQLLGGQLMRFFYKGES